MENLIFEGEKLTEVNEKIRLIQRNNGLTFGTDAFLLASFIKPQKSGVALELGGGTGIISLLCATRDKFKHIHCAEIQEEFANIIGRNITLNSLDEKMSAVHSDIRDLKPIDFGFEFDAVFSNPPYMRADSGKQNEHYEKYVARHEVCGDISDFCASASRLLKHGGLFYCVYRPDRLVDLICAMREHKLEPKEIVFVHANTKSEPSIVLVRAKKGASASVLVQKPLFLNSDENPSVLTERAREIYNNCNF